MATEITRWIITVDPASEDNSADGIITLPQELSDLLSCKTIPYSLEQDNSTILHALKATSLD